MAVIEQPFSKRGIPEAIAYSKVIGLFKREAKVYAKDQRGIGSTQGKRELVLRANSALDTLYFLKDDPQGRERFYQRFGEESAEGFDSRLQKLDPLIDNIANKIESYQPRNIFQAGWDATRIALMVKNPTTSDQQRARLYSLSGYSPDQVDNIIKNLRFSTMLTGANAAVLLGTTFLSGGFGFFSPIVGEISGSNMHTAMAFSYGVFYSSVVLNMGVQNVRLLQSEINNCSNAFSTAAYYLTEKFLPANKRMCTLLTGGLPLIPFTIEDIGVLAAATLAPAVQPYLPDFFPPFPAVIPTAVIARNFGLSAINLIETGLNEIWLQTKGRPRHNPGKSLS